MKKVNEEWRDINGYEGLYQVSSLGNIKSLDRTVIQSNTQHGKPMERLIKGKMLTPTDNGHGYKIVGLRRSYNGRYIRKNYYVHRLVAEAFISKINADMVINHLDYDTANNSASNLEVVSQEDNIQYSREHMKKPHRSCKKTNTGEKYIRKRKDRFYLHIPQFGICKSFATLKDAVQGRELVLHEQKEYFAK